MFQSRELTGFFSFHEIDRKRVGLTLQKSLQDLVDQSAPTSAIQFRLACRGISGVSFCQIILKQKRIMTFSMIFNNNNNDLTSQVSRFSEMFFHLLLVLVQSNQGIRRMFQLISRKPTNAKCHFSNLILHVSFL